MIYKTKHVSTPVNALLRLEIKKHTLFTTGKDTYLFYDTPLRTNFNDETEFFNGDDVKLILKFMPIGLDFKEKIKLRAGVSFHQRVSQKKN